MFWKFLAFRKISTSCLVGGKWKKKVSLFQKLNFCFAKSNLRVSEDIWEKSRRKVNDIVEIVWNSFVSKTMILSRKLATKKWKTKWASFSSYNMWVFQSHFATEWQHDVQNSKIWCMLKLCENAQFLFKNLQNGWIHSLNWFTFQRHSAFRVSKKCFVQIPVWWIHLTTTLWHPKILTQNVTFRKKCWKFVD